MSVCLSFCVCHKNSCIYSNNLICLAYHLQLNTLIILLESFNDIYISTEVVIFILGYLCWRDTWSTICPFVWQSVQQEKLTYTAKFVYFMIKFIYPCQILSTIVCCKGLKGQQQLTSKVRKIG